MPMLPNSSGDGDGIGTVRRQFAVGLAARIVALREDLEAVSRCPDDYHRHDFFRKAHTLKGAAACFRADVLLSHANRLTDLARGWVGGTSPTHDQIAVAQTELQQLELECERYLGSLEASP